MMARNFDALILALLLGVGSAMAQTFEEKTNRLVAHERVHTNSLASLPDEALLVRVALVLDVCETPVAKPGSNYVNWYATRMAALKNEAMPRLKVLSKGSAAPSVAAEARSLMRRIDQRPGSITTAAAPWWSGVGASGALGSIQKPHVTGGNSSAHIGHE